MQKKKIRNYGLMQEHFTLLIILTLALFSATAQVSEIQFSYDDAGNRISRSLKPLETIYEHGVIEMAQGDANEWTSVSLQNTYQRPVVLMGPISYNGSHPSTVRVSNVTSTSFDFQVDEWDYKDGAHTTEQIGYLVVEPGLHSFGDLLWQAGVIDQADHTFQTVHFPRRFSDVPVILTQVATYNETSAVATRVKDIARDSFNLRLQEEEAADGIHAGEQVAYLAIDSGAAEIDGDIFEASATGINVDEAWHSIAFASSFDSPMFLGDIQTYEGPDPASLRHKNLTSSSVEVFVEEEQSGDSETGHVNENIGYLVIGSSGGLQQTSLSTPTLKTGQDTTEKKKEKEGPVEPRIRVYPNPTGGNLTVEFAGYAEMKNARIWVYSMEGQWLRQVKNPDPVNVLNISGFSSGMYIIRVKIGDGFKEWRVVKE